MNIKTIQLQDNKSSKLTTYLCDAPLSYNPDFQTPAVIICPGGGFGLLSPREMEPIALKFVNEGISAFVLEYPVGDENVEYPTTLISIASAVAHVRSNVKKYHIIPNKITLCGFSAGGYVAASLAVDWQLPYISENLNMESTLFKPNSAILCYPVIDLEQQKDYHENEYMGKTINLTDAMRYRLLGKKATYTKEEKESIALQNKVTPAVCPCFLWHTADDISVNVNNSLQFASALSKNNVPFELHIFQSGLHGLALGNHITAARKGDINPSCAKWFDLAIAWMEEY